jgi:hypothetical protein
MLGTVFRLHREVARLKRDLELKNKLEQASKERFAEQSS